MPTLSTADLALYRAGQPSIRRYLSVAPRVSVYTATVSAISTDDETGGIHQLTLAGGVGTLSDIRAGCTVDIGTSAGGCDVGKLRVRKNPTGSALDVGETAPAACPVQIGQHVTVRAERKIWRTLPRIVGTRGTSGIFDSFTDYGDYDIAYSDQNDAIQPHANITADAGGTPVRPAAFVDTGQTYRTVTLHSGTSVALAHGATIASVLWDVSDGTLISGTSTSASITARFPVGFRYLALTVTDSNGTTHTRYLPIWAHDADNPPLTAFHVRRDVRTASSGRLMEFEFFGTDDSLDESVFPEGATLCCWEIDAFGASGMASPASQTDAMLGWALRDAETLRIGDRSRLRVEIGGLPAWLDRIAITPQTLRDLGASSAGWDNMRHITADRAVHFALRRWSSALDLANFYPSGVTDETQSITLDGASLWRAASNAAASGRVGVLGGDSLNGIWLRRDFNHLSASERSARSTVVALTAADWTDADGLTVETERAAQIGAVDARGSAWDSTNAPTLYAACAPGRTAGAGIGRAKLPPQILPTTDAQTVLNALVGHRLAALNNPRAPIRLRLLHPIDALEPAWNEPVTLTWASGGLRDTVPSALSALVCMVERVEIEHGADASAPKIVRWTLIPTTSGQPGDAVPVTTPATTSRPPTPPAPRPPTPPGVNANTARIAVFGTDNRLYRTTNFLATSPHWTSVNLAALTDWNAGTLHDFAVDAYSPGYIGGGSAINGWIVTSTGVQRVLDIFGTVSLGAFTSLSGTPYYRQIQFERGAQNWGLIAWYEYGVGVSVARTTDGANWTTVSISPQYDTVSGNAPKPGLWLDPHRAGHAVVTAFSVYQNCQFQAAVTYESFDYGATWDILSDWNAANWLAGTITVPFADRAASAVYHGASPCHTSSGGFDYRLYRGADDISPTVSGATYGVEPQDYGWRRIAFSDADANALALVGRDAPAGWWGVFFTRSASAAVPTWQTVIAPSASMPYRGVYLAGDDASTLYLIGENGAVGKSTANTAGTQRIQSKKGDLSMTGTLVGLCGG